MHLPVDQDFLGVRGIKYQGLWVSLAVDWDSKEVQDHKG